MLVPTKRQFDITAFFSSYCSENKSEVSLGNPVKTLLSYFPISYPLRSKIPGKEPPLECSAMTVFLFQVLVFCSEVVYTLVPDADQFAKNPKVSHFGCRAMTENTLYALHQI